MPEFNHLCSLDIVANRQLLHLWLNRFVEVSRLSIKEFCRDDSSPQQTSIYCIINTYPYLIYIYISLIVNLKGIIQFRWKFSKENAQRIVPKAVKWALGRSWLSSLQSPWSLKSPWHTSCSPVTLPEKKNQHKYQTSPLKNPLKVDLPANAQIDR